MNGFEDVVNDIETESSTNIYVQNVCMRHLKFHKTISHPEKAEFLMLFGALLEYKIKYKIKKEIDTKILNYWDELPTLITRGKPHGGYSWHADPFKNKKFRKYLRNSTPSLAEFIIKCFTYNSSDSIFRMLSDFALVEDFDKFNKTKRNFDLQNCTIKDFFDQRNFIVHELIDTEINNVDDVKNNLDDIYLDILEMISRALKVRGITIDNLQSSEKDDIITFQLNWLKKILYDLNNYDSNESLPKEYFSLFSNKNNEFARNELKSTVKKIMKKVVDV